MPQYYGLSDTEYYIMEKIWNSNTPLSFSEILEYFTEIEKRGWKKQTIHTYLSRLIKKGVLTKNENGKKYIYEPALTKEEYIQQWTKRFLAESFEGSLGKFMLALTGGHNKLSPDEINELKDFLNK